jgi:hypothetical protein
MRDYSLIDFRPLYPVVAKRLKILKKSSGIFLKFLQFQDRLFGNFPPLPFVAAMADGFSGHKKSAGY